MEDQPPRSILELLNGVIAERRLSERGAAEYIGVSASALNLWRKKGRQPEPASCRLIAQWSGYPYEFVMQLAGHWESPVQPPSRLPTPDVEVIPEIRVILRTFSLDEQRRYLLPWLRTAKLLREETAGPPPGPAAGSQAEPGARPRRQRRQGPRQ
jgi:hypothetical protein